jgi:hypothetical protein
MAYGAAAKKDLKKAIEILKLMVALFPQSCNAYDSLGEVYMMDRISWRSKTIRWRLS